MKNLKTLPLLTIIALCTMPKICYGAESKPKSSSYKIRECRSKKDSHAVARNLEKNGLETYPLQDSSRTILVTEEKKVITGVCAFGLMNDEEGYIDSLSIDPKHQGKGQGSALLAKATEILRTEYRVNTIRLASPQKSVSFYEKHGFLFEDKATDCPIGSITFE